VRTRGLGLAVLVALALFASASSGPASARTVLSARVVANQKLAVLLGAHVAFSKPNRESAPRDRVQARRPITGERTVLPVLGARGAWLHVALPGRPNGHTGWIRQAATVARMSPWRLAVGTSTRRVTVYRSGTIHRMRIEGVVNELYDVIALPGIERPTMIGFRAQEIRRVISIES